MSLFLLRDRETTPARSGDMRCQIFAWIGQSFSHCDFCGHPVSDHLYHPPYGGARPLFWVKQYQPHRDRWVWAPVGSLVERAS